MDELEKPDRISFFNFANQDLPAFVEVKGKDWIYYGEKNDFPYYLIDLYTQSAYHKAIIDGKVSYICGNGWNVNTEGLNTEKKALALNLLNQPFGIQNLDLATLSWSKDAELFNGVCVKVSWHRDKKSATLSYIDMCNIRTNADMSQFYYTAHWFKVNSKGERTINNFTDKNAPADFQVFKAYDPEDRTGEQIYYWKEHHPDQKVYPLPVYQGASMWINIDIDLSKYFYHTVKQCFTPTHLINFNNGEPSAEKARAIEEGIKGKWTSPDGQRIITSFNQNKESAATIETLQMTDADKQYDAVRKMSEQAMFTGHRVTSGMLFGVYREGSLGGRSELQFAEEHFQNSYVTPRQQILENIINMFAKDFGITVKFYLNKVRRVGYMFSDQAIEAALTPEEKRVYIGEQLGIKSRTEAKTNPAVELLKTISSISPLVANKVLESLSVGEIRDMVGLGATAQTKVAETVTTEFSSQITDEDLVKFFERCSHDGSNYEVISERCVESFTSREDIERSETEMMAEFFVFESKTSQLERIIIDQLTKDGTLQPDALAKIAKTSVEKVNKAIASLTERKILSPRVEDANGEPMKVHDVNEKGAEIIDEKPAKTSPLKVVYSYGLAPNFKGQEEILPNGRTREWCEKMIKLSRTRVWTSEEIFALDPNEFTPGSESINPWLQRGGWYTKPGTDVHVPQCRHAWIQKLVKVKEA